MRRSNGASEGLQRCTDRAVHLDQFAGPGERRDVAAHGFARYAEPRGKIGDAGTAAASAEAE
jgi:hypothetical protein